jgi:very-short-patch-repair endonuclease
MASSQRLAKPVGLARAVQDRINEVAAGQHGVVTRTQLREAGLPSHAIDRQLEVGLLRPLHRGVYALGPLLSPRAPLMAAVLACGHRALVSHRSGAVVWDVWPRPSEMLPVDTTVEGYRGTRQPGIRVHRVQVLPETDRTVVDGVPVTTVAKTLVDLAACASARDLERALAQALRRGLTSSSELMTLVTRWPGRRGRRRLLAALKAGEPAFTRSEAEELLLQLLRKARLPKPEANASVGGFEVDFLWRSHRLVVEVDGFAFHSSAEMFESDRRRDALLTASGFRVMRITWRQLTKEREALLVVLAQAIARGS